MQMDQEELVERRNIMKLIPEFERGSGIIGIEFLV
jgi:hypothetical protein